ncbi:hypothetical protein BDV97DRAFT_285898, partial [Delphinella strobiligena]
TVQVGAQGKAVFAPQWVDADVGDIVRFTFRYLNHTVTQSTLNSPCVPHGLDTGFSHYNLMNTTNDTMSLLVTTSDPQFYFCSQTNPKSHCHAGMVFATNPGNNMESFLSNAM